MTALVFVDTNVLVYARDRAQRRKQPRAEQWLTRLWDTACGRLSTQVLSEYWVTVTRKLKPGMAEDDAWLDVRDWLSWDPVSVDARLIVEGHAACERWGVSWWDGLIIAAARTAQCQYLLSEDFQAGQEFGGTKVISPFADDPSTVLA